MGEFPRSVPAMSGLDLPTVPAARSASRRRLAAAALATLAAAATVVSTFVDLLTADLLVNGESRLKISIFSWGFDVEGGQTLGGVPIMGYPLVFAAVLLFAAASVSGLAVTASASPGTTRVAALLTAVAAAFLVGVVWSLAMQLASFSETFLRNGPANAAVTPESSVRPGVWFLVVAVALAAAATVTALPPVRRRAPVAYPVAYPVGPEADMPTPRHGFPVPVTLPPPATPSQPFAPYSAQAPAQPNPPPATQPPPTTTPAAPSPATPAEPPATPAKPSDPTAPPADDERPDRP